jgi:hypothetical protein
MFIAFGDTKDARDLELIDQPFSNPLVARSARH